MEHTVIEKRSFHSHIADPAPGSLQERLAFAEIQNRFSKQFQESFPDRLTPKTIVIIPSLTLDQQMLRKMRGHLYYEERMLCMLHFTSTPAADEISGATRPI